MKQISKMNQKGFTLIELMIVIAIIGILAAIAIPNYIAYRDKAFCSAAESDANALAGGIADYFAIPGNVGFNDVAAGTHEVVFPGSSTIVLSGNNTAQITGADNKYEIEVTDVSARCPITYQNGSPRWSGVLGGTYTMTM